MCIFVDIVDNVYNLYIPYLLEYCLIYSFVKFIVVCDYGYKFVCSHFERLLKISAILVVFHVGLVLFFPILRTCHV